MMKYLINISCKFAFNSFANLKDEVVVRNPKLFSANWDNESVEITLIDDSIEIDIRLFIIG